MGVIWYKVWFDLWHNKTRTLLAVLSIAAGVFAVGMMFGMVDLLIANLDKSHQAIVPPHINVGLITPIDRDTALNLKQIPGVEGVEPYNSVSILYKIPSQDKWRQGVVEMRADFEHQTYQLIQLRGGRWPEKNGISIERMAAQFLNVGIGDTVTIKIGDRERTLPITGLLRHPFVPPPQFADQAFFFMDSQGLERLDIPDGKFGSLHVRVTPYSSDHAQEVATAIKDQLAKQNVRVGGFGYQDPNKHWGRVFFDGINMVLQVLALVAVAISAVLVYNTLSNLIAQQTNQIGILKAIGGRTPTIIMVYLTSALVYGFLALIIAIPLGALAAYSMTQTFLNIFNIDYDQFAISTLAVVLQVVSAMLVSLIAGLVPTLQGAAITVRQAIASYGLGRGKFGLNRLDRVIEGFGERWLPAHYATALGNMFRRKERLILTQFVLITAGAAFLMVMSLTSSLSLTLDNIFARRHFDTMILFRENQRSDRVMSAVSQVEGVDRAELRFFQAASLYTSGQKVKEAGVGTTVEGIPVNSDFFSPMIVAGRWLAPGDNRVVILTRETAKKSHIQVGNTVTLDLGELGKGTWQVIGLYDPVFAGSFDSDTTYVPLEALFEATKKHDQGILLYVRTTSHTPEFRTAMTARLKDQLEAQNLKVLASQTLSETRSSKEFQFSTVIWMLLALSVIVAVVGGIALMGALSISVVERIKEIGVLRAVGARSHTVLGLFVMEGVLQGVLSWLVAVPVSFIVSPLVASGLGQVMFGATLDYQYNWLAVSIWLGLVLMISALASIMPAHSATRISVRDSLAYA